MIDSVYSVNYWAVNEATTQKGSGDGTFNTTYSYTHKYVQGWASKGSETQFNDNAGVTQKDWCFDWTANAKTGGSSATDADLYLSSSGTWDNSTETKYTAVNSGTNICIADMTTIAALCTESTLYVGIAPTNA